MKHITILFAALILLAGVFQKKLDAQTSIPTSTDVPRILSYQGQVTTTDGKAMNGTHHITTTLYSDPHGTNSVWHGEYNAEITNGIFNVILGSGAYKLPEVTAMNRPLWVGIKVDGGAEMQPRTQLTGVPYAFNVPDGSITMPKLAPDVQTEIFGSGHNPKTQAATGFNELTTATNSTATMTVGSGATLTTSGSGIITANDYNGTLQVANGGTGITTGAWLPNGNTLGADKWIGSKDNYAVEVHLYDFDVCSTCGTERVMRWEPNSSSPNLIGGFHGNTITGTGSVICGGGSSGFINSISSNFSGITSGKANTIGSGSNNSFIMGGASNTIGTGAIDCAIGSGDASTINNNCSNSNIMGGETNVIQTGGTTGAGKYCTIPGGDHLLAQSYAQTVTGYYNTAKGTSTPSSINATDPLLIVGNGTSTTRSNAFEVFNNGTSVVYNTNGSSNGAITGATYKDNIIYAWAYWDAGLIVGSFGVTSIVANGGGSYTVTLNLVKSDGTTATGFNNQDVAIVVSPYNTNTCTYAQVLNLSNNTTPTTFNIQLSKSTIIPPCPLCHPATDYTLGCDGINGDFMFIMTGRPK